MIELALTLMFFAIVAAATMARWLCRYIDYAREQQRVIAMFVDGELWPERTEETQQRIDEMSRHLVKVGSELEMWHVLDGRYEIEIRDKEQS